MRSYLRRHWRGELSLGRSFWLNYVLLGVLLAVPAALIGIDEERGVLVDLLWIWLPLPIEAAVLVWQVVGVWRSARRTVRERRRWLWPRLAQGWMVIAVLAGLAGTAVLAATSVQVAQVLWDPTMSEFRLVTDEVEGEAIFHGALSDRAGDRLVAVIEDGRFRVLRIRSHGGLRGVAARVARKVRQHGTKVVVEQDCISACVFILAASRFGAMRPDADVVLHRGEPVVTFPVRMVQSPAELSGAALFDEFGVARAIYRPLRARAFWQPTLRQMATGRLIVFIIDPDTGRQIPADVWCLDHAEACDAPRWTPAE